MSYPGTHSLPRVANVSGDEHCRFCCQHLGLVIATHRRDKVYERVAFNNPLTGKTEWRKVDTGEVTELIPEFGPCPMCEAGQTLEFPKDDAFGPWGSQGFWRGVDPSQILKPECTCDQQPLPRRQVIDMLSELRHRLQESVPEVVDAIEGPNVASIVAEMSERTSPPSPITTASPSAVAADQKSDIPPDPPAPEAPPEEDPDSLL